jgi:hypothetical protein
MSLAAMTTPADELCFDAAGVALLMPAASGPEIAVLLGGPEAPSGIAVEVFGREETFLRMRHGPLVHGMLEPYRQTTDGRGAAFDRVTGDSHELVRLADAGRLFGAADTAVLVPRSPDGRPIGVISLPLNPIGSPRRAVLNRAHSSTEAVYALRDEVDDPGWACPVCGRVSPNPEPHTAEHGVPGHLIAGILPGERLDQTSGYSTR